MTSKINSAAISGLDAIPIEIETDLGGGLPNFLIVGLPDKSVEEAKERVRSAIKNSNYKFPQRRITINLAPADLRKEGSLYDLPIAVSLLSVSGQLEVKNTDIFAGELSLDGSLRRINGALPIVLMAKEKGFRRIFIPKDNAREAAVISGIEIYPLDNLSGLISGLRKETTLKRLKVISFEEFISRYQEIIDDDLDMSCVSGQEYAKRALEIAASGGHNIFMKGPPGTGKTLLAKTFSTILPKMTFNEMLEISKIYSISGLLEPKNPLITKRPFRNPHHTASHIALVGGGQWPRPGEISLAHRGVLFMDELPEFQPQVLEVLRQPLEERRITISRASGSLTYPSNFVFVAAANPCPCGFLGDEQKECTCSVSQILRYSKKISGPLLDRIDMYVEVPKIKYDKLEKSEDQESSASIRTRVEKARNIQEKRFLGSSIKTNSEMGPKEIKMFCQIDKETQQILRNAVDNLGLSARGFHKILKLARTIADLENRDRIELSDVAEALQYRNKEF